MASNSNAGVQEQFTTQFAREVISKLAPPRLGGLIFKPHSCKASQIKCHVPHRKHHDLSSSPCAAPPLHQAAAWQAGVAVLSAV